MNQVSFSHMAGPKQTIAMRPDPDVRSMMEQAQEATGSTASELLNRCVRKSILEVAREIVAARQLAIKKMGINRRPPNSGSP